MKYAQILETLTATPLLITPGARESLVQLFERHATLSAEAWAAQRAGKDVCGENVELESMTIEDGIARIPITGPLGIRLGAFEKGAGAVDYLDIMDDLAEAAADPTVKSAVLYLDTPGGMFSGLPETSEAILAFDKPIYAYCPPGAMACSAGYWLAASTDGIFASPSSPVGSIGVYTAYHDLSELAAARGIKVKLFTSGKYKGMGVPGTPLTEAQATYLQTTVMAMAEQFYRHVREQRGDVDDETMQGQKFMGAAAVAAGLVDQIVGDEDEVLAFLR